jgi:FG-GAP repeat
MTPNAHRLGLVAALALGAVSCAPTNGLHVELDLGAFQKTTQSLKLILTATPDGFQDVSNSKDRAIFASQDVDGDGKNELVVTYNAPFSPKESFVVATKNHVELAMHAEVRAFDATQLIAGAFGDATLPGGGAQTLKLALEAKAPGIEGPKTRSTDLLTGAANVVVKGPAPNAGASTVAACALDNDGKRNDLVIGVPGMDRDAARLSTGAVFVVFNADAATEVKLDPSDASQLVIFGAESGDLMGAAVACANLDGDKFDDLILGAPNAANGAGRVYVVSGRPALNTHAVDLDPSVTTHPADVVWGPSSARPTGAMGNGFGSTILAFDFKGDDKAELLISEPERKRVHLLQKPDKPPALVDVDLPDHPVLTGVSAVALAAGDFDGTKTGVDVVVGDPSFVPSGGVAAKGAVLMFANVGLASTAAIDVAAVTSTMVGDGSGFGTAVLALDTTGRGEDLFVGAPSAADGRGLVYRYEHDNMFFLAPLRDFKASAKGAPLDFGDADATAGFGGALGACRSGSADAPTWALVVGAPNTRHGTTREHVGAAYLLASGATFSVVERLYGVATQDRLGSVVTCADLNDDMIGDLVTVAPSATGTGARSGVVYGLHTHAD